MQNHAMREAIAARYAERLGLVIIGLLVAGACGGSDLRWASGSQGGGGSSGTSIFVGSTTAESTSSGSSATGGSNEGGNGGGGGAAGAMPSFVPACDAPAVAPSGGSCFKLSIDDKCNPVTLAELSGPPCDEECSTPDSGATFTCYTSTTHKNLCEECGENLFCNGGMACPSVQGWPGGNHCARYCCDDADCGSGKCIKNGIQISGGPVGLCLVPAP